MANENKNIGSSFDDFLIEDGILEDVEIVAIKRVLSYQIQKEMKERKISKTLMAKKMQTSRAALNRLLDPQNTSITLQTLSKAARVVGKNISLSLV